LRIEQNERSEHDYDDNGAKSEFKESLCANVENIKLHNVSVRGVSALPTQAVRRVRETESKQDMSVAWGPIIRFGRREREVIEDSAVVYYDGRG